MAAYYNEIDKFAAQWLRELIKAGLIADGEVDERDIRDVQADDLRGFVQCHFFAGIGGWSYALRLAGWPDDRPVWTGSCPCQPFAQSGKRNGEQDARHLWPIWFPLIKKRRPPVVLGEQVANKDALAWLDGVSCDLEDEDYAFAAADLCAAGSGALHVRPRLYYVGHSSGKRRQGYSGHRRKGVRLSGAATLAINSNALATARHSIECDRAYLLSDDGVSTAVARKQIHGFGNAIVPQVAQAFIESYLEAIQPMIETEDHSTMEPAIWLRSAAPK